MDFEFWFIPTFGVILGLIVGWFYAVFLACLVPCLWHVLLPQLGGYCGRWTRAVPGWFRVKNWLVPELPRSSLARRCVEMLLHGWAQICNLGYAIAWVSTQLCSPCILGYTIAWVSTQLRSPCTLSNLQLRTVITPSSELRFGCFWTLWKAL